MVNPVVPSFPVWSITDITARLRQPGLFFAALFEMSLHLCSRCVAKLLPEALAFGERCIALRRGRHSGIEACVLPSGQQFDGEGAVGI
jgi:hypothetical protein